MRVRTPIKNSVSRTRESKSEAMFVQSEVRHVRRTKTVKISL